MEKISSAQKYELKINTNRRYILNPANRPKNIIQLIGTKNSVNRREFSSSQK